jgi:hypothetical protein
MAFSLSDGPSAIVLFINRNGPIGISKTYAGKADMPYGCFTILAVSQESILNVLSPFVPRFTFYFAP